uniref:Uncharacterized protein n=1 Tax=Aegilops tauschii subsp. strangulata TaxID=200361 RepID=A0A453CFC3_AEGTS
MLHRDTMVRNSSRLICEGKLSCKNWIHVQKVNTPYCSAGRSLSNDCFQHLFDKR